ncbi:MAG: hypothetical protein IPM08_17480 [Actinomycetales bacterium]|nr:hypothetical protein [Actinomycetales bacterium]
MWKIGVALLAAAILISAVNSGPRAQALYAAQVVVALAGLLALLIAGGARYWPVRRAARSRSSARLTRRSRRSPASAFVHARCWMAAAVQAWHRSACATIAPSASTSNDSCRGCPQPEQSESR